MHKKRIIIFAFIIIILFLIFRCIKQESNTITMNLQEFNASGFNLNENADLYQELFKDNSVSVNVIDNNDEYFIRAMDSFDEIYNINIFLDNNSKLNLYWMKGTRPFAMPFLLDECNDFINEYKTTSIDNTSDIIIKLLRNNEKNVLESKFIFYSKKYIFMDSEVYIIMGKIKFNDATEAECLNYTMNVLEDLLGGEIKCEN